MPDLLQVEALTAGYGATVAVEEVSFTVACGESVSILGRNGMGKTSTLGAIARRLVIHCGRVWFDGADVSGVPLHRRARLGIALVPQEREIFPSLSVEENLLVGARKGPWTLRRVFEMFPRLKERVRNRGSQLSGGEQQMLAIARALMANPRLLLLDEPSEGLAPVVVDELAVAMKALCRSGDMAIVLVEQSLPLASEIADRTLVMNRGRVAYDGPSESLQNDHELHGRLLGVAGDIPS